jgi:hypothetical protein
MNHNTPHRPAHGEDVSRGWPRDARSMTFDELDEAFQRGAIDATTLVLLQCLEPGAGAGLERHARQRSQLMLWHPARWEPQRAARTLLAAVTRKAAAGSLDAMRPLEPTIHGAPRQADEGDVFVKALALVLVFVLSAIAAAYIAAAPALEQDGTAPDERASVGADVHRAGGQ